jgi:hypothetical protein
MKRAHLLAPQLVLRAIAGGTIHVQLYDDPDDGSITDGDDHVWIGNLDILKGSGRW